MNFIDELLNRILHNSPGELLGLFLLTCAIVGFVASLLPAIFFQLLEHTPKTKARNKRELNAELQHKYEIMCAMWAESQVEKARLKTENTNLLELLNEETTHNRDWDIRAKRHEKEKERKS